MRLRTGILFILTLTASALAAQLDTVYYDKDLTIRDERMRLSETGSQGERWTRGSINEVQRQNLAQLFSSTEAIYIKSYGPGILSSSSLRGGQAGHSLVLWNGLPVQSPLVGQLDFALLDLKGVDQLRLLKGGQSSMWGSGAIGGVISLDNSQQEKNEYTMSLTTGSFGLREAGLSGTYEFSGVSFSTRVSHRRITNDFPYMAGTNRLRMENARQVNTSINQDVYFKLGPATHLALHYWGIIADRQIPPTTNQNLSDARQRDDIHRFNLGLVHSMKATVLKFKLGYFDESLDYSEERLGFTARTGFQSFIADLTLEGAINNRTSWILGANAIQNSVKDAPSYPDGTGETRTALFGGMHYRIDRIRLMLSLRQDMQDAQLQAPVPSLAGEYSVSKNLNVKAKLSRNFRYPSLNDRYWIPGGNPELEAESGWSAEAGPHWRLEKKEMSASFSATAFHRKISNWIQWSPDPNSRLWTAYNLNEVWSRGLELRVSASRRAENHSLGISGGYDFVRSTSQKSIALPKIEKGEQIWYTPEHTGFARLEYSVYTFKIQYFHKWHSDTRGINASLASFDTGLLYASYKWQLSGSQAKCWLSFENIWNQHYRIIENRPMPGRQWRLGLSITLN